MYDAEAAAWAVNFFPSCLQHVKGAMAGKPFVLEPWESQIIATLFGWKRPDGTRRYRNAYLSVGRKNGKALALDTPLPTPNGWTTMGAVRVGDYLFDENGLPARVVAVTEIMNDRPCMEVAFSDGCRIVADEQHEWLVSSRARHGKICRLTTIDIAATCNVYAKQECNYSIRACAPRPVRGTRSSNRQIVSVRSVPSVPVRCVQVDSPSHLYLAGESMIPTHNSSICAGVALYLLSADSEPGAEVYSAGGDREQAAIVFDVAGEMVARNKELRDAIRVYAPQRRAVYLTAASFYKALSSDAYTKHGLNPHGIIFDELHVQKDRDLWDVLQTALGARTQPLTIAITTAGYDRHSICHEQYVHACRVRDGVIDDVSFLPVIYEVAADANWQDERLWKAANPNLGISVSLQFLRDLCAKAKESAAAENTFRRLHLNQWVEQDVRYFAMDAWDKCQRREAPDGLSWFAGLDLANTQDITALVLVGRKDGFYYIRPHFWIPKDGARVKEQRDRVPYGQWERDGFVTLTPGRTTDYGYLKAKILEYRDSVGLREVAFDPWNAGQLTTELKKEGLNPVLFAQGGFGNWAEPTKLAERLVLDGKLIHNGNPILRWMAANTVAIVDNVGNVKPAKGRSQEKIDGIVAMIMGMARAMLSPDGAASIYETQGLMTV